jgi:peptide/nickel transport system substrate-binding protein
LKVYDLREDRVIFYNLDQSRDELLYSSVKGKNPFKDKRVRQAMYQAIDIETMKKQVMRGLSAPTGAVLANPDGAGIPAELQKRLPFDLAAAKKLMIDAGYPNGFDVTLDCPNNRYVNDERICVATAAMLAKIGINVTVNAGPWSQMNPKGLKRDTSFMMLGWGGVSGDGDAQHTFGPVWHSPDGKSLGGYNWGGVKDDALDKLLEAQAVEADPVKRRQMILDAVKLNNENIYRLPLHLQFIPWASRANVTVSPRSDNYLMVQWVTKK